MATVTLDCSEYDMLRESKKKAEQRIEELENENKNLKENSSCVVKTRTYEYDPDNEDLREFIRIISGNDSYLSDNWRTSYSVVECLKNTLRCASTKIKSETVEVVGFDEIRTYVHSMIADEYRKTMEIKKNELESEVVSYKTKRDKLKKEYEEKQSNFIKKHEEDLKREISLRENLDKSYQEVLKERDEMILTLKQEVERLSKTQEEKEKEALQKIKEAEAELTRLKESVKSYQPKGFWHSLFSRIFM